METKPRILALRAALGWSQAALGEFLGASQHKVWQIEKARQAEPADCAWLLDMLARAIDCGSVVKGMTPADARAAIMSAIEAAGNAEPIPAAAVVSAPHTQPGATE
jgi:transcriptional regulator with XRE-family HTH domain